MPSPALHASPTDPEVAAQVRAALARAAATVDRGDLLGAVDELQAANRELHDPEIETRLVQLRDRAFERQAWPVGRSQWPPAWPDRFPEATTSLPEITPDQLDVDTLGSGIVNHGALVVRGLLDPEAVGRMVADIDRAFDAYDQSSAGASPDETAPWFVRLVPSNGYPDEKLPRSYVRGSGGVWAADSPRMLYELVELFDRLGLRDSIAGYLGERPALSVKKCTLRRVPVDSGSVWHQDGAFMGDDLRTVNVWIALTDCGGPDSDAPALDLVPRRFDHLVETGTHGALFDTFVGQAVVEREAGSLGIVRPRFSAGDALLFDDLFLHATAVTPTMTTERYAIEAWFFAPSSFPPDQVPLVF